MSTANSNSVASPAKPDAGSAAGAYIRATGVVEITLNSLDVAKNPPNLRKPHFPANLVEMQLNDVLKVRDAFIIYRASISDELSRCRGLELPAKEQADLIKNRILRNTTETNADRRKAAVETDANYITMNASYVQFKAIRISLEGLLEQADIVLERLRDECFYKQNRPRLPITVPAPVVRAAETQQSAPPQSSSTPPAVERKIPILRPKRP